MGFWDDEKEVKVRTTTTTTIGPRKRRKRKSAADQALEIVLGIILALIVLALLSGRL